MYRGFFASLWLALAAGLAPASEGELGATIARLELRAVPLGDALALLAAESNANIIASLESAARPVSCHLNGVSVRQAVEALAQSAGLWVVEDVELGLLRIGTGEETPPTRANAAPEGAETRVLTVLYPNALEVARAVANLFGPRVQLHTDTSGAEEDLAEIGKRFERLELLSDTLSGSGRRADSVVATGGVLAAAAERDQRLGEPHPAPPPEAAIYLSVLRRNNQLALRSRDRAALDEIAEVVRSLDVPSPQVLLEVKVLELDLEDGFSSAFEFDLNRGGESTLLFGDGPGPLANSRGAGTLLYQFVDSELIARLELLQRAGRVTTLARPMLLVANNEASRLFVGEERPIVRSITSKTTVNENSVTNTPDTQFEIRSVGTTLLLTPSINADRTVTLRVLQETSQVQVGGATIPIVGPLGTVTNQPIDVVSARSVVGTVVAKDGLALALGGLIDERVADVRTGVPFLMDIPVLGFLFRAERKVRSRRELVVIVRPWVLFTPGEGEAATRALGEGLLHPSGAALGDVPLGTFGPEEAPRGGLGTNTLWEMFQYQSGLPDGG